MLFVTILNHTREVSADKFRSHPQNLHLVHKAQNVNMAEQVSSRSSKKTADLQRILYKEEEQAQNKLVNIFSMYSVF